MKKLSSLTGISPSHILRMEGGEQDFTVTKFCRLSDALGIPAGLALESALFHDRDLIPGESNAYGECGVLVGRLFDSGDLGLIAEKMGAFVVSVSKVVQSILLSANPQLIGSQVRFPIESAHERLAAFAGAVDPLASITERISIIKALNARPYFKLKSMGVLDDQILIDYIDSEGYKVIYDPGFNVSKHLLSEPDQVQPIITGGGAVVKRRNKQLTEDSLKGNTGGDMKTEVQKLIERVKRKAAAPGARADLARTLDVAPARVSEWLSGKKEPGGEYALRLLKWVET